MTNGTPATTTKWMTTGDKKGRSPLIIASMFGYVKVVELIIKEINYKITIGLI